MPPPQPPAFARAAPLPLARRRAAARLAPRRRPTTPRALARPPPPASPPVQAVSHATGKPLTLRRATAAPPAPGAALYVLCPACNAAYLGNAVTAPLNVSCARCSHRFRAAPEDLYTEQPATPAASAPPSAPRPPAAVDTIVCTHMSTCPGCTLSERVGAPPVAASAARFLQTLRPGARARAPAFAVAMRWRTHAKLAARRVGTRVALGLFRRASHALHEVPECAVHSEPINAAARAAEDAIRDVGASAYDERTASGDVRYVLFTQQRATGQVQVTFVWNAACWKDAQPVCDRVAASLWRAQGGRLVHSVWSNWNTSRGNAIVSQGDTRFYHMHGPLELVDPVMGVDFRFQPYAFRQANLDAFESHVLSELLRHIPVGSSVAEFCAGVGVIGLVALKQKKLRALAASEINPAAERLFWKAFRSIPKEYVKGRVSYTVGSDSETLGIVTDDTDIVIVDPPRAGLSPEAVHFLAKPRSGSLRRILYLSCGFNAFKNDARILCDGMWKLRDAYPFILFPGSDHLELLAIFERKDGRADYNDTAASRTRRRQAKK